MIKVKELIAMLAKLDLERMVMLSSDEEGNSIAPLYMIEESHPGEVLLDDAETDIPSVVLYPSGILQ